MSTSYSQLQEYRSCPRLFAFTKLGYKPPFAGEPMTTGQLAHIGIAEYFKGGKVNEAIRQAGDRIIAQLDKLGDYAQQAEALKELEKSCTRALQLVQRYVGHWAEDYTATLVEPELELGGVIIHPDLIATYQQRRVIVDFKTTHYTDPRRYAHSGQTDLYAYILKLQGTHIDLVIYDIISEEGIYRLDYPPRLDRGKYLFCQIRLISQDLDQLLAEPHWSWDCAGNCDFYIPCYLRDDDQQASYDYLVENFLKGER